MFVLLSILMVLTLKSYEWREDIISEWTKIWYHTRPLASADHFFDTIREADRLVVRDGGFDCCDSVNNDVVLFTVTDLAELKNIREHIQFVPFTNALAGVCMCCGYPGLDWYKGSKRIALTAVQHGFGLRWSRFGTSYSGPFQNYGDVPLTLDSSIWIIEWLRNNNVTNGDYSATRLNQFIKIKNSTNLTSELTLQPTESTVASAP